MTGWLTSGAGMASAAGAATVVGAVTVVVAINSAEPADPPAEEVAVVTQDTTVEADAALQTDTDDPAVPAPTIDLVRVEPDRSAVIAGTAIPGSEIQVLLGEAEVETVNADSGGNYVALAQLPNTDDPQPITVVQTDALGRVVPSNQSVLVMPSVDDNATAPRVVVASTDGISLAQTGDAAPQISTDSPVRVAAADATAPLSDVTDGETTALVQPDTTDSAPRPGENVLTLDTISYDQEGEVTLAGRGSGEQFVRVYVDNTPVQTGAVPADGQWTLTLPDLSEGTYTLRVDEIDAAGTVISRVESPFRREAPADVAQAAINSPLRSSVTVQPGHTLWALARDTYGDGVQFVQIFEANKDRIRNPDLIYPGQVFDLPQ